MCDCYTATCAHPGCTARLPMHLEDFATDESEVEVFCDQHLPDKDVRIWFWREDAGTEYRPMGIRALTENARAHKGGNYPNAEWGLRIIDIDNEGVAEYEVNHEESHPEVIPPANKANHVWAGGDSPGHDTGK